MTCGGMQCSGPPGPPMHTTLQKLKAKKRIQHLSLTLLPLTPVFNWFHRIKFMVRIGRGEKTNVQFTEGPILYLLSRNCSANRGNQKESFILYGELCSVLYIQWLHLHAMIACNVHMDLIENIKSTHSWGNWNPGPWLAMLLWENCQVVGLGFDQVLILPHGIAGIKFGVISKRREGETRRKKHNLLLWVPGVGKKNTFLSLMAPVNVYLLCLLLAQQCKMLIGMKSSPDLPLHSVSASLAPLSTVTQWLMRITHLCAALYTSQRTFWDYIIWSNLWTGFIY